MAIFKSKGSKMVVSKIPPTTYDDLLKITIRQEIEQYLESAEGRALIQKIAAGCNEE